MLLFIFFQFYSVVSRDSKVDNFADFLFFFSWLLLGLVFWPRLGDLCVCQSPVGVCVLFSRTGAVLCIYHLFVWSNLNLLNISQWITLPTQSCYYYCYYVIFWFSDIPMSRLSKQLKTVLNVSSYINSNIYWCRILVINNMAIWTK